MRHRVAGALGPHDHTELHPEPLAAEPQRRFDVRVARAGRAGRQLAQRADASRLPRDLVLGPLELGDVAADRGVAERLAGLPVPHEEEAEHDGDGATGLEVPGAELLLDVADPSRRGRELPEGREIFGHDEFPHERRADLGGIEADDLASGAVEEEHVPIHVREPDEVGAVLDQLDQLALLFFEQAAELPFGQEGGRGSRVGPHPTLHRRAGPGRAASSAPHISSQPNDRRLVHLPRKQKTSCHAGVRGAVPG